MKRDSLAKTIVGQMEFTFDLTHLQGRPEPNRAYDQIYMDESSSEAQVRTFASYLEGKNVVFLGDGDCMSIFFARFARSSGGRFASQSICVLDFDERITSYIKKISDDEKMGIQTDVYNVIEPLPKKYARKFNFFYINPPYGSKNNGDSCLAWLYRCMDLCTSKSSGCIVFPYQENRDWTVDNMRRVQSFLNENGFVIRDMVAGLHGYILDDPDLKSAALIVDRCAEHASNYAGQVLPATLVRSLYGAPRPIPRKIRKDDACIYGKPDFDWAFGGYPHGPEWGITNE